MIVYGAPEQIAQPDLGDYYGKGAHAAEGTQGYLAAEAAYIAAVGAWARSNGSAHPLAGELVSVPYADGAAQYVVAKFDNKVCLIHIDTGDGWRDGRFERTATVAELKLIVESRRKRAELFGRNAVR